ncbi:MAG: CHASE2 domain-containing protein [Planctomycetota bacterium]
MSKTRRRARRQTLLVGLAVTAAVVVVHALGGWDWLELKTLDLRFLYANSITASDALALIDIDDESLTLVRRWPWPRDIQAGLIEILREAGLRRLLYDIELSEPEFVRTVEPPHADILAGPEQLGVAAGDLATAYPDHELRLAIADAAPVYLAFHYLSTPAGEPIPDSLPFQGEVGGGSKASSGDSPDPPVVPPGRGDGEEGEPPGESRLGRSLALPQRRVADSLTVRVQRWFGEHPEVWYAPPPAQFARVFSEVAGGNPALYESAAQALRAALNMAATTCSSLVPAGAVEAIAPAVPALAPVYFLHARAAARCGFVVFEPDRDGVMRRTPLLVRYGDVVLPQLAFAVAFDELRLGRGDVQSRPGRMTCRVPGRERPLTVQLDRHGRALVPWVPQRGWHEQFGPHVPMGGVWQVYDRRLKVRQNQELIRDTLGDLLAAAPTADDRDLPDAGPQFDVEPWRAYQNDLRRRLELDGELRLARYRDDGDAARQIGEWIRQYDELLKEEEATVRALLAQEHGPATTPADPPAADRPRDAGFGGSALQGSPGVSPATRSTDTLRRAFAANDAYQREIDDLMARLRQRVAGKIGLIGYTATALADMTPIPTSPRAPGVIAHANLLSGLLTGQTVRWSPAWLNVLLTVGAGLLATLVSARWRPRPAALLLLAGVVAYAAMAGWLAFYVWIVWIALVPVLAAVTLGFFAILLFRYVFLERESRQIATALSQYTSATLARQMAENAELCRRAEVREVTAMFTDLAGFTTLSERIGATRTQHVLNVVLGRLSEVVLHHEGMINKFIGDGVFAFWNPVIYPQADHARRACAAALDIQEALRQLVAEQWQAGGDEAFSGLWLRIGLATGNAVVGPCGSEQKYDYTCIGDSVNVASRLESANKFYGTRILVSGATCDQAGAGFVVRPLGGVQVKGKTQAVPIYELLGRVGEIEEAALRYAERFGAAVAAFQQRRWETALAGFEACTTDRPDDSAALHYLAATRGYLATPPAEDWTGALELTEK